jgi:hypothetical protein
MKLFINFKFRVLHYTLFCLAVSDVLFLIPASRRFRFSATSWDEVGVCICMHIRFEHFCQRQWHRFGPTTTRYPEGIVFVCIRQTTFTLHPNTVTEMRRFSPWLASKLRTQTTTNDDRANERWNSTSSNLDCKLNQKSILWSRSRKTINRN